MSRSPHTTYLQRRSTEQARQHLSALRLVEAPRGARLLARLLILIFLVSPFLLIWLPWQQAVSANGRVMAYDPAERQQDVEAPIDGRILRWYVKEGQPVRGPVYASSGELLRPGDKLVSIQDPDPDLPRHLDEQRQAIQERKAAARERIASFKTQITALETSRTQALAAAKNRIGMADQRYKAADESVRVATLSKELAETNFRMESDLVNDGLTSQLSYVTAKQRREQTLAEERRASSTLLAARDEVDALRADLQKIDNDATAAIQAARAAKQAAEAELATASRDLADLEIRIGRQGSQEVTAACDGTVYRILANASLGGAYVKSGDRLAVLTPDIKDPEQRMVELFLDGNDAPQLTELWRRRLSGDRDAEVAVRLQFEGWPAIQVIGWPNIAWGTFAGKVVAVDMHDDGKGKFRILVKPDPDGADWPSAYSLRQGVRARGWVLLDQVSLGYELWRRFNGFPPVVVDKDDGEAKQKPSKVKVPK